MAAGGAAPSGLGVPPPSLAIVGTASDLSTTGQARSVGLPSSLQDQEEIILETPRPRKSFIAVNARGKMSARSAVGNAGDLLQSRLTSREGSPQRGVIFFSFGW
jgi:hypothetical protein